MQVAVIGAGVIGVCTAYFLAEAGHEVVVIERHGNVAEESSFGNSGAIDPTCMGPWAAPGMPRKILAHLYKSESPVLLKPRVDRALWRWLRLWLNECTLERYRANKTRMQRVAFYSRDLLFQLRTLHHIEYEQTQGYLQLFRSEADARLIQPALDLLDEGEIPYSILDADGARLLEPGLSPLSPLAGALHFPQDESGNCPLFTKHLKQIAQSLGVQFRFSSTVTAILSQDHGVALQLQEDGAQKTFNADAVVLAGGADSSLLLEPLGIRMPLYPVKTYSATAMIKNFDEAPLAALLDETYKTAITRMGTRLRVSGTAELGAPTKELREAALRTLIKVGDDWFPDAANYHGATFWNGTRAMLPDGAPLLGATPLRGIFLNLAHGSSGWAMAAGSGKILADLVSGQRPDIDMEGLTLARYA